ncbi:hypothetical protein E2C01_056786 [Portunus trituberculatus]|uniref:Uncharacterized protein n=1 Tax=Portunus trituberculatus TaxID=210409 RepID=A0A5B7H038_PORTR|nr:hypothetical protein [Portunus trituberculatus]
MDLCKEEGATPLLKELPATQAAKRTQHRHPYHSRPGHPSPPGTPTPPDQESEPQHSTTTTTAKVHWPQQSTKEPPQTTMLQHTTSETPPTIVGCAKHGSPLTSPHISLATTL